MSFTGLINLAEELTGLSVPQLVQKGYPEEVARKIASGELPMDPQSIATRQQAQGYGDTLYRGHSNLNQPRSDQDMWMSTSPSTAQTYADQYVKPVYSEKSIYGEVTPLRTNADDLAHVRGEDRLYGSVKSNSRKIKGGPTGMYYGTDRIAEAAKESGNYQGTRFSKVRDDFSNGPSTEASDVYNILGSRDDVQIRHADRAAYDPEYKGDNIMGFAQSAGDAGQNAVSAFLSNTTSLEDSMGNAATEGLLSLGVSPERAEFWGPIAAIAPQFLPFVGAGVGVDNTIRALDKGNYGEAAFEAGLTALGEIPIFGDLAAKGMRTGADKLGIFGGGKAYDANTEAMDKAVEMQEQASDFATQGNTIEKQRKATGEMTDGEQLWFVGADNKPRFEISDDQAKIRGALADDDQIEMIQEEVYDNLLGRESGEYLNIGPLWDHLDHPELFHQYPSTRSTSVMVGDLDGARAAYGSDPNSTEWPGILFLDAKGLDALNTGETKSGILHEMQHAIQEREGWARGSSAKLAKTDLEQWAEEHHNLADVKDYYARNNAWEDLVGSSTAESVLANRIRSHNAHLGQAPRPGLISNQSDWYRYSDKIRREIGPMPKRKGPERDAWQAKAWGLLADHQERALLDGSAGHTGRSADRMKGLLTGEFDLKGVQRALRQDKKLVSQFNPGFTRHSKMLAKYDDLASKDWRELYGLSAGEAEARATQLRMYLTHPERALRPIQEDYTIPGHLRIDSLFGTPKDEIVPIESLLDVIGFPDA